MDDLQKEQAICQIEADGIARMDMLKKAKHIEDYLRSKYPKEFTENDAYWAQFEEVKTA